jgi:thymidylate synthase (FAD)
MKAEDVTMNVQLLAYTPNPEQVIAAAAKLCYAKSDIQGLFDKLTPEKTEAFLEHLASLGHESPIEHVSFTFGIEGVSRALLAQITRHRLASYSVQSQRYVEKSGFDFVIPPEIEAIPEAREVFLREMEHDAEVYATLRELLVKKHTADNLAMGMSETDAAFAAGKKANEDARMILPNACDTRIIVTMNARSLYNFFRQRCCQRAQWEIRAVATEMLRLVKEVAPTLFGKAGPACVKGACSEGSYSCGKQKEMRAFFTSL